ncbi:MAG: hypothetical protein E7354_00370 [Clostridiales bacterium]|nr:hypothetical protein [Clostridiales bacterium]
MGIIEFFRKKFAKDEAEQTTTVDQGVSEEKFVSDLSFVEMQDADWRKFAGILKKEGVLSNSYEKSPVSIEYYVAKDNTPVVDMTFKSATSDSVRRVQLMNNSAFLFVNGAIESFPETKRNKDLNRLWADFQNRLRHYNMVDINREGYLHALRGKRLMKKAQKMMGMRDIYDREQEFLKQNKDAVYDEFCYSAVFERNENGFYDYAGEMPKFVPLVETEDGHFVSGEPVMPFTPRTLEHCILRMTEGQKVEDGEFLVEFEKKCRQLQEYSCFESEDWDRVIGFGKNIVRNQYLTSMTADDCQMR